MKIIALILITAGLMTNIYSQNLEQYQWQKRLLLVISDHEKNNKFVDQIKELNSDKKGLKERKLLIINVLPNQYKIGLTIGSWHSSNKLYTKYYSNSISFKVILIGLDGTIKSEKNDLMTNEELFYLIDKMPMRQREIRDN